MTNAINPNIQYASLFINSLAASGLRHVCIAPGSRSTPLTLAFETHPAIAVHLHLDERCAAFFALGLALASDTPVALVCTSGSAAANFFPAIIEANMSQVPLLILTADRPPELRHSGANQTIDQIKLYGDHVLWSVDAPLPESDASAPVQRNVQTLASRAFAVANGVQKGAVHINFPFRKPLEPERGAWERGISDRGMGLGNSAFTIDKGTLVATETQLKQLTTIIQSNPNGIIICGPRCPGGAFPPAVAALSQKSGFPIFADPTSGVRYGEWVRHTAVLSSYETFLQLPSNLAPPDVIIRFGALPISKWLNAYLSQVEAPNRIHIRQNGVWADDSHLVNTFLQVDETAVCQMLCAQLQPMPMAETARQFVHWDSEIKKHSLVALEKAEFDGSSVAELLTELPDETLLFMGNSLPIRHLDQYGFATEKRITAYANRGASGIDGNISTALGMHVGTGKKLVLVIGDITFYHDLNGLLYVKQMMAQQQAADITIIVINNNGGGIFNRLPISQIDPPFTKLFITPHHLDFEPAVRMYGLAYERFTLLTENGRSAFRNALIQSLNDQTPRVIELQTNGQIDEQTRKATNEKLKDVIRRNQ